MHTKKKKQILDDAQKGGHVTVLWSWSFSIEISLVVISKYWTIYLHQTVSAKFSWCEANVSLYKMMKCLTSSVAVWHRQD